MTDTLVKRSRLIMLVNADITLPDELRFLFAAQLEKADVIVLNKIDLLSKNETKVYIDFSKTICPEIQSLQFSER